MKNTFKRSTAWMLCLALMLGLFAGVPGAVITKANAAESEATVEAKNLLADFNPSFEEYSIPNWTIDDGVVQYRENAAEDDVWSLQINVKDAAATSAAITVAPYWTYNASVQVKGAGKLTIAFFDAEGAVVAEESAEATAADWQALTVAATAPAGAATAVVKLSATTAEAVYFDDAALTAGAYTVPAPVVPNAGLENWNNAQTVPTDWLVSTDKVGLVATPVAEEVEGHGFVAAYNMVGQGMTLRTAQFEVTPGAVYNATMEIMVASGSFRFQFLIRFFDADGKQVNPKAAWSDTYVESTYGVCDWQAMSHAAIAPATAATAQVWVTAPDSWAQTTAFKLDNVNVAVVDSIYDGSFENPIDNKKAPMGHRFRNGSGTGVNTDPAYVMEGKQSLNLSGTANHLYSAPVPVVAGETYKATIYVKTSDAAAWAATESTFQYYLRWIDAAGENFTSKGNTSAKPTGEWTAISVEAEAPAGAVAVMTLIANAATLPVYIDCESVVCTSANNLLANAGFENRTTGTRIGAVDWNCGRTDGNTLSTIKYDADKGYVLHWEGIEGANLQFYTSAVPVTAGKTYTVSADFKAVPETVQWIQVYVRYYDSADNTKQLVQAMSSVATPGDAWTTVTKSLEAPEGATHARILVAAAGIYGKVDGVTTYGALADFVCDNFAIVENCEHDFSGAPVVTPATCVTDGTSVVTCACGATSTTVIPATGVHAYESVVTEPTCGAGGYTTNTCTVCGLVTVTDNKPATGAHTPDEGVKTPATEEADGYTTYTCTTCGTTWVETDEGSKLVNVVEIIRNGESAGKFYTIGAALAKAQAGDTLSLLADVNEGFNFPGTNLLGDLTLEGNDFTVKGTIRLQSASKETLISNITIKNVVLADDAYLVISVGNYDGVTIQDCTFTNGYITTYANNGLKNVTITGCLFENPTNATNNVSAIIVSGAENLTISNNIILNTQWNAIQVGAASGEVAITGNEINWDVAADVDGAYNLHGFNGAKVTIKDNIVTTGEGNADKNIVNVQSSATNTAVYLYDDVSINTALLPDVTEAAGYTIYCTGHNFVDGTCDICGATNATANVDENLTIVGKDMLLGGYIGAQFTVNPEATGAYDSVYIVVVFDGQEFTYNVPLFEGAHVFEHRVAPKYMGEALKITAYGVKGDTTYTGVTVEWSIKDGIMERLAKFYPYIKYAQYKNRCILLVDMLYYGAAAQTRFGTDGNGLVTDGLDAKYVALKTATEPTIEKVNTATKTASNQLYQVNLGVEDAVQMQFTFRLKVEDYSQYVVKITANGTTYEYTGESFIPQGTSSTLKKFVTVVFDKLEAVNMRDDVTIELWQNGAKVSDTYTMSIEGFATTSIANGQNVDLLKAMIAYGDSAKVSLGK